MMKIPYCPFKYLHRSLWSDLKIIFIRRPAEYRSRLQNLVCGFAMEEHLGVILCSTIIAASVRDN